MQRNVTLLTCDTCFWYHTSFLRAWECWQRASRKTSRSLDSGAGNTTTQGSPDPPTSAPRKSRGSDTVFRDGRAGKSGRPGVSELARRRKAADRAVEYRKRKRGSV